MPLPQLPTMPMQARRPGTVGGINTNPQTQPMDQQTLLAQLMGSLGGGGGTNFMGPPTAQSPTVTSPNTLFPLNPGATGGTSGDGTGVDDGSGRPTGVGGPPIGGGLASNPGLAHIMTALANAGQAQSGNAAMNSPLLQRLLGILGNNPAGQGTGGMMARNAMMGRLGGMPGGGRGPWGGA